MRLTYINFQKHINKSKLQQDNDHTNHTHETRRSERFAGSVFDSDQFGKLRAATDPAKEKELIAQLTKAETPGGDKAIACKMLAMHGTKSLCLH